MCGCGRLQRKFDARARAEEDLRARAHEKAMLQAQEEKMYAAAPLALVPCCDATAAVTHPYRVSGGDDTKTRIPLKIHLLPASYYDCHSCGCYSSPARHATLLEHCCNIAATLLRRCCHRYEVEKQARMDSWEREQIEAREREEEELELRRADAKVPACLFLSL